MVIQFVNNFAISAVSLTPVAGKWSMTVSEAANRKGLLVFAAELCPPQLLDVPTVSEFLCPSMDEK